MDAKIVPSAEDDVNEMNLEDRRVQTRRTLNEIAKSTKVHDVDDYNAVIEELAKITKGQTLESREEDASASTMDMAYYWTENALAAYPGSQLYALALLFLFFLVVFTFLWFLVIDMTKESTLADASDDFVETFGGNDKVTTFENALYMTLQVLTTGGYDMSISSKSVGLRLIFFFQIIVGLVVFAILVGFITEIVQGFMEDLNKGKSKVTDHGHTLILGWNEATLRLIAQIGFCRRQWLMMNEEWIYPWLPIQKGTFSFSRVLASTPVACNKIVILANMYDKAEMQDMISNTLSARGLSSARTKVGRDVICRVGDPTSIHDLVKVATMHASSILIMMTKGDKDEMDASDGKITNGATIRTLLAVRHVLFTAQRILGEELSHDAKYSTSNSSGKSASATVQTSKTSGYYSKPEIGMNKQLRIVVQLSAPCPFIEAAKFKDKNGKNVVFPVDLSMFLNSLMFTCTSQHGLAQTLLDIFNFEGVSIRRRRAKELKGGKDEKVGGLIGLTFGEAQDWVKECILIGVVDPSDLGRSGDGLAPPRDRIIRSTDIIIFLDNNSMPDYDPTGQETARIAKKKMEQLKDKVDRDKVFQRPDNVLICGWRNEWSIDPAHLKDVITNMINDMSEGSAIVFLNLLSSDEFTKIMSGAGYNNPVAIDEWKVSTTTIKHIEGDAGSMFDLYPVVEKYSFNTSIVLGTQAGGIDLSPHSRDTRVMSILLILRQLHKQKRMKYGATKVPHMHVIGENQEDSTSTLVLPPRSDGEFSLEPDFINTQAISARVLAQTLAYPVISDAISEIFDETVGKAMLAFELCAGLVPTGIEIDFATIKEFLYDASTDSRVVCIGIAKSPKNTNIGEEGTILLPADDFSTTMSPDDRLIVFKAFEGDPDL